MEDFLNSLNNLKECFEKTDGSLLKEADANMLKTQCLSERIKVIEHIQGDSLRTSRLVHERLAILKARSEKEREQRITFLDRILGK